jgi:hypothetical protein
MVRDLRGCEAEEGMIMEGISMNIDLLGGISA